ncbi:phosphatidylglycerophosphatase A family protein [Geomesophilobacter sediminis]|uniref:Phosphatidylglycerophosphatase A n=1 Tax=Geomesophilobacter sediminis TaxID=2798584 RepID=A0A8J7JM30_9BACT|nr:phosphatidylglycerophosphatase A [Geomesophilobacter sediminis]MBJ6725610.1 phosphatidylglycerophosphatase A [Geomesophilobacter sediminis]
MKRCIVLLATWFGTGLAPIVPGTFGTAGAIPFFLILSPLPLWIYLLTAVTFTVFACWVAGEAELVFGEHDPGKIVIDEVAGYLFTMAGVPVSVVSVLCGFFFFRVFDILKPQPARWLDRNLKGGYGVVLDDVAAGFYACAATHLVMRYL